MNGLVGLNKPLLLICGVYNRAIVLYIELFHVISYISFNVLFAFALYSGGWIRFLTSTTTATDVFFLAA